MLAMFESGSVTLPGMSFIWAALVALAGALIYFAATNPKLQEVGRIMFAMGLLAVLLKIT